MDNIFNPRYNWLGIKILLGAIFLLVGFFLIGSRVSALDCTVMPDPILCPGVVIGLCTNIPAERTVFLPDEGGVVLISGKIVVASYVPLINDAVEVKINAPKLGIVDRVINLSCHISSEDDDSVKGCDTSLDTSVDVWKGFPNGAVIEVRICAYGIFSKRAPHPQACLWRRILINKRWCGDGILEGDEECEPERDGQGPQFHPGDSCRARGYAGGYLVCTDDCRVDTSNCEGSVEKCEPDGCNKNCPPGCEEGEDPDCGCIDNNFCCGIGCDHANDNDCPMIQSGIEGYRNPLSWDNLLEFIRYILKILFYFNVVVFIVSLLVSAYYLITGGAAIWRVSRAKKILLWSLLGFVIILIAQYMVSLIKNLL